MSTLFRSIISLCLLAGVMGCAFPEPGGPVEKVSSDKYLAVEGFMIQRSGGRSWLIYSTEGGSCKLVKVCRRIEIEDGILRFLDGASLTASNEPDSTTQALASQWNVQMKRFQLWILGEDSAVAVYGKISPNSLRAEYYVKHWWQDNTIESLKQHPVSLEFTSVEELFLSDKFDL